MTLECIGMQFRTVGRRLIARVAATGEILRTAPELTDALAEAEQRALAAEQRAQAAEAELARLWAELAKLQGNRS